MKSVILCLVLCACSGNGMTEEVSVVQEHVNPPKDQGRIETPTSNGDGCHSVVVMSEGELFVVPQACNEGVRLNSGDPIQDKGDPAKLFLKKQEQ